MIRPCTEEALVPSILAFPCYNGISCMSDCPVGDAHVQLMFSMPSLLFGYLREKLDEISAQSQTKTNVGWVGRVNEWGGGVDHMSAPLERRPQLSGSKQACCRHIHKPPFALPWQHSRSQLTTMSFDQSAASIFSICLAPVDPYTNVARTR